MTSSRLSPKQVAARINVSVRLVRDLITSGTLPAVDVSRPGSRKPRYRVSEADLTVFESRRMVRVAAAPKRRRRKNPNLIEFF